MRMCKYCGKIVDSGHGPRGVYCTQACWNEAEGFDNRIKNETGKISLDVLGGDGILLSDGGAQADKIYNGIDDDKLMAIMVAAIGVHPKLPSALLLIMNGKTQQQAADAVGLKRSNLSVYTQKLRKTLENID